MPNAMRNDGGARGISLDNDIYNDYVDIGIDSDWEEEGWRREELGGRRDEGGGKRKKEGGGRWKEGEGMVDLNGSEWI